MPSGRAPSQEPWFTTKLRPGDVGVTPETTLACLLPPDVAVAAAAGEHAGILLPVEEAIARTWSPKRVREFAAGRTCARLALSAQGHAAVPLLPGPKRAPQWPAGFVG